MQAVSNKQIVLAALVVAMLATTACVKQPTEPIDNTGTLLAPYTLLVGSTNNSLYKTNDGISFDFIKPGGGSWSQSVMAVDTNIVFVNNSINVGSGMRLPFYAPQTQTGFPVLIKNGTIYKQGYPNMSFYDAANKNAYVCGLFELRESNATGIVGTWNASPFTGTVPATPTSVAKTANGDVFTWTIGGKLYKKTGGLGNFTQVTITTAPPTAAGQFYFLSAVEDKLLLSDYTNTAGIYYSTNGGVTWSILAGIPLGNDVTFGKGMQYTNQYFTALDTIGLYRWDYGNNILVREGLDLPKNIRIYDMVSKRNVYRTGLSKIYYYLATDQGLYKSDNDGNNWTMIKSGEYSALY
jgi:hypothetical protein